MLSLFVCLFSCVSVIQSRLETIRILKTHSVGFQLFASSAALESLQRIDPDPDLDF